MEERLNEIEKRLNILLGLVERMATNKTHYTTAEAAKRLGRANFTVQQYCRKGAILAQKSSARRGRFERWVIEHAEICRFEREGPRKVNHQIQHRG